MIKIVGGVIDLLFQLFYNRAVTDSISALIKYSADTMLSDMYHTNCKQQQK